MEDGTVGGGSLESQLLMSSYFTYWTGAAVPDLRPTPSSVTYGYAVDLLSSCKEQLSFLRAVYEELKAADPHSSASYINLYNQSTEAGISEYMMVCLPVVLVGYFVFTANKSVSALSQTGSMQSRATYAQRDKRAKAEDAALVAALEAHRKEADKAAAEKEADKAAAEKKAAAKASPPAASAPRVALPPSLPKITVSAGDKIIYSWGVMNVALTAYFLGHFPQHFYIWHTPKCVIMLVYRWVEVSVGCARGAFPSLPAGLRATSLASLLACPHPLCSACFARHLLVPHRCRRCSGSSTAVADTTSSTTSATGPTSSASTTCG